MGNSIGLFRSESNEEAVLLVPAMNGNLDEIKGLIGDYLATYHSKETTVGYVPPGSDPKLQAFCNRCDAKQNDSNAIHAAAFAGHLNVVQFLHESCGASLSIPNGLGCTPLWLAAGYNRIDVLTYLLEHTTEQQQLLETNSTGDTPLLAAASRGHLEVCQLLLKAAAEASLQQELLRKTNHSGDSPLHVSIASQQYRNDDLIDLLLASEEQEQSDNNSSASLLLNQPNKNGLTPLLICCERDDVELLTKLLQHGADMTVCDATGASPLAIAAFCGSEKVVTEVILKSPELPTLLNKPNDKGCTPIWLATRSSRIAIVKLLLQAGADATVANKEGVSSKDLAKQLDRTEITELYQSVADEGKTE